jgi:hypothetical protein
MDDKTWAEYQELDRQHAELYCAAQPPHNGTGTQEQREEYWARRMAEIDAVEARICEIFPGALICRQRRSQ